jgi:CDP-diacylglycerol--serine O-phosphatidyltransferase
MTPQNPEDEALTIKPMRRTVYLFPNLLTTGALLCGFLAMVHATRGQFSDSALFIFAAAVFDGLDGRVARLFNAQSKFGEQYDSMSDLISFGAAPALTVYLWSLHQFGRLGIVVAALYCIGAALRLARFNAMIGVVSKRYFQGLPSPAAAAMVASMIYALGEESQWSEHFPHTLRLILVLGVGILMVTNVPYYSFKELDPRRAIPFKIFLLLTFIVSIFYLSPHLTLFGMVLVYALSGLVVWLWRWARSRQMKTFIRD